MNISDFKTFISTPKEILITTHPKPDADALGSSLAMKRFLETFGHKIHVVVPTDYPEFLYWMTGNDDVVNFEIKKQLATELVNKSECIICLDFNNLKRIDELGEIIAASKAIKVMIDHHIDPDDFADFTYVNQKASATAELIYELICMLGEKSRIDIETGECIYAGIMTDTGSFRFPSTSAKVHLIIADLMDLGVNHVKIHRLVYDNSNESRLRFLGHALSQRLFVLPEYKTAYFAISKEDQDNFVTQNGDTEGLVNYALSIKGIHFAAMIKEDHNIVKMSFRSVGDFSVNEFSRAHFNGGGHKNAAGGRSDVDFEKTINHFVEVLPLHKEKIIHALD